jgi:hypothetical protein
LIPPQGSPRKRALGYGPFATNQGTNAAGNVIFDEKQASLFEFHLKYSFMTDPSPSDEPDDIK